MIYLDFGHIHPVSSRKFQPRSCDMHVRSFTCAMLKSSPTWEAHNIPGTRALIFLWKCRDDVMTIPQVMGRLRSKAWTKSGNQSGRVLVVTWPREPKHPIWGLPPFSLDAALKFKEFLGPPIWHIDTFNSCHRCRVSPVDSDGMWILLAMTSSKFSQKNR